MSTPHLSAITPLKDEFDSKKAYGKALEELQEQMLYIQQALYRQEERAIIVFEGSDASGKGGIIRRMTQLMDPRGFRVHAIGKPNPREQGRHYLWRFFQHLPPPGRIAVFDSSWYGRVLVERVEGFASDAEWQRAYQEINEFERWLTDDGVRLIKVFLSIDEKEQSKRFVERLSNPRKYWKLTDEDLRNRQKWDDYVEATNDLFAHTHTNNAPWLLVDGRHKWRARVHVLRQVIESLSAGIDVEPPAIDPSLLDAAQEALGIEIDTPSPDI